MKFNYMDAVERIIRGHNGHLLTETDTVYKFPTEIEAQAASNEVVDKYPEVRVFKTSDILVLTPPRT